MKGKVKNPRQSLFSNSTAGLFSNYVVVVCAQGVAVLSGPCTDELYDCFI